MSMTATHHKPLNPIPSQVRDRILAQYLTVIERDFNLTAGDREIVASICANWNDAEVVLEAGAGSNQPLGQFLTVAGKISPVQLDALLALQARTGHRFGELAVAQGLASTTEITALLELQQRLAHTTKTDRPERLGNLLLRTGDISSEALEAAVLAQDLHLQTSPTGNSPRIGEMLVARGVATPRQIEHGLKLQSAIGALAFMVAVMLWLPARPVAAASTLESSDGKTQATSKLDFSVRIPAFLRITRLEQPALLTIEAKDVEAGYVDLPANAEIEVTTNSRSGYQINFQGRFDLLDSPVRKIRVEGLSHAVEIDAASTSTSVPVYSSGTQSRHGLRYHFTLAPGARPGTYPWPVSVSASMSG